MQQEEITNYIVKELGKHRNPKDIAMDLCEKENMTWEEAKKLVYQTYSSHHQQIASNQGPILIGLSIATFILGFLFIVAGLMPVHQGQLTKYYLQFSCIGLAMCIGGIRGMWDLIKNYFKGK